MGFLHDASELQREPGKAEQLWTATKCGESDTTSRLATIAEKASRCG